MNKRRAIAAETTQSRCKVLSIQYVYYFRAYQRQRTLLHGIGVITKLYFAIFAAYEESKEINDLEPRSEVIQVHTFWQQSKASVRLYIGH